MSIFEQVARNLLKTGTDFMQTNRTYHYAWSEDVISGATTIRILVMSNLHGATMEHFMIQQYGPSAAMLKTHVYSGDEIPSMIAPHLSHMAVVKMTNKKTVDSTNEFRYECTYQVKHVTKNDL